MENVIDQLWECPTCGTQIGMGSPGKLHPPRCSSHGEMEQKQVQAWRQPHEWEDNDGDE